MSCVSHLRPVTDGIDGATDTDYVSNRTAFSVSWRAMGDAEYGVEGVSYLVGFYKSAAGSGGCNSADAAQVRRMGPRVLQPRGHARQH